MSVLPYNHEENMRKKRAITLLEIMIVILLIGLITGVVSYNLKGTLDKGKAFASDEGAKKLVQDRSDEREVVRAVVLNSGLISARQVDKFLKDGWNEYFNIRRERDQVVVSSRRLEEYNQTHHTQNSNAQTNQ
jgi:type II secretory pathway pseudopilin PulG